MHSSLSFPLTVLLFCFSIADVVTGFAAKKSAKRRSGGNASTNKGFGKPPPTFGEILTSVKTRVPPNAESLDCPCGSGKEYGGCCRQFHLDAKIWPQSPLDVLKTRYSAFAYRLPGYVIDTTHRECRDFREDKIDWIKDLDKQGMFDSYDFISLEAGEEEAGENDSEAYVDFKVTLKAKATNSAGSGTIEGKDTVVSERSRFLYDGEPLCWRYAGGDVRSDISGLDDIVLNK